MDCGCLSSIYHLPYNIIFNPLCFERKAQYPVEIISGLIKIIFSAPFSIYPFSREHKANTYIIVRINKYVQVMKSCDKGLSLVESLSRMNGKHFLLERL